MRGSLSYRLRPFRVSDLVCSSGWASVCRVTGWAAFFYFALAFACAVGGLLARPSTWAIRSGRGGRGAVLLAGPEGFAGRCADRAGACLWPHVLGAAVGGPWPHRVVLSIGTVFTTAMIYTQLKTVPRWNTPVTPVLFLSLSLAGGALLAGQGSAALLLLLIAGIAQVIWWMQGDKALSESGTTLATATGLGAIGKVRSFEPRIPARLP